MAASLAIAPLTDADVAGRDRAVGALRADAAVERPARATLRSRGAGRTRRSWWAGAETRWSRPSWSATTAIAAGSITRRRSRHPRPGFGRRSWRRPKLASERGIAKAQLMVRAGQRPGAGFYQALGYGEQERVVFGQVARRPPADAVTLCSRT